jgi:hypothetical protein
MSKGLGHLQRSLVTILGNCQALDTFTMAVPVRKTARPTRDRKSRDVVSMLALALGTIIYVTVFGAP